MNNDNPDWPFEDPPNTAVFTTKCVMERKETIRYVFHNNDGAWQFHCIHGASKHLDEAIIVGLAEIVEHDPSVKEVAELPFGWCACRESPDSEWVWVPYEEDDGDEGND